MTNPLKLISLCFAFQLTLLMSVSAQEQKPELVVQTGHSLPVNVVAFSPDGRTIASGRNDGTVKLWSADNGSELRTFHGHPKGIIVLSFSHDGKRLSSASQKLVIVWDILTGEEIERVNNLFVRLPALKQVRIYFVR